MSDDEADPELLELLRQHLGTSNTRSDQVSSDTGVLKDAEYIYNNAIDVSIDMYGTKAAAASIHGAMQERGYSTEAWSEQELHPRSSEGFVGVDLVNFVFTMDLLNFSFWSELPESERFYVDYRGKLWSGYKSLVASLRRALDDGVPITTPRFWRHTQASDETLRHVFRSATDEEIPLLSQRIAILREAADVLHESFGDPDEPVEDDIVDGDTTSDSIMTPAADTSVDQASNATETGSNPNTAQQGNQEPLNGGSDRMEDIEPSKEATSADSPVDLAEAREDRPAVSSDLPDLPAEVPDAPYLPNNVPTQTVHPQRPNHSVIRLIERADHSAGKLVNLLAKHFPCFRDETRFDGRRVRLLKRAQIFVADLWAAFNGMGYGEFHDIDQLTMFADYRIPQMLLSLGVLSYSPPLHYHVKDLKSIASGHSWEVQLRGCSIWAVELIRREILRNHPEAEVNAVLIDFFLYDLAKEREKLQGGLAMPHHRTRSIWY